MSVIESLVMDRNMLQNLIRISLTSAYLLPFSCSTLCLQCPLVRKRNGPVICVRCDSGQAASKSSDTSTIATVPVPAEASKVTQPSVTASDVTPSSAYSSSSSDRPHFHVNRTSASHSTPMKRVASPTLNHMRQEENPMKKTHQQQQTNESFPHTSINFGESATTSNSTMIVPSAVISSVSSSSSSISPNLYPRLLASTYEKLLTKLSQSQSAIDSILMDGTNQSRNHSTHVLTSVRELIDTIEHVKRIM